MHYKILLINCILRFNINTCIINNSICLLTTNFNMHKYVGIYIVATNSGAVMQIAVLAQPPRLLLGPGNDDSTFLNPTPNGTCPYIAVNPFRSSPY